MYKNFVKIFIVSSFFVPSFAFAYTSGTITSCTDVRLFGTGDSCTSGNVTTTGGNSGGFGYLHTAAPFVDGTTYYLTANDNVNITGPLRVKVCDTGTLQDVPSGAVSLTLTASGCGSFNELTFQHQTNTAYDGLLSSVCISDSPTGCGGTPSPTSTAPYPNGSRVFGTNNLASTTFSIVDNPTQDLFAGFILLLTGFFGTVWLLTRRR